MVQTSSPFPTKSSIYNHMICSTSTKAVMKNVAIKGPRKALMRRMSSFFNTRYDVSLCVMNDANGAHDAKLRFSPEEIRLATDEAWILTKNSGMEKIVHLMAELSGEYRVIWAEAHISGEEDPGSPKISRGENYRGLPWVMLDYPGVLGRDDVMAIRAMFWWGHAFIVTLHL